MLGCRSGDVKKKKKVKESFAIKSYPGADFQVLLVNEATMTGGAERRADYGHLLTSWAPVFSPSEVIPVVGEHHSIDPHLRLVVTVQQHKYASNIERIYNHTQ